MRLADRITVKKDTSADGAEQASYTNWLVDWPADIKPVGGGETYRGNQLEGIVTHIITTRYTDGFLPTMKAVNRLDETVEYRFQRILEKNGKTVVISAVETVT